MNISLKRCSSTPAVALAGPGRRQGHYAVNSRSKGACFLAATVLCCAGASAAGVDRLLPARDASAIYAPAALPGTPAAAAIARAGYVQEEYLLSGIGNIYEAGPDGRAVVKASKLAYTTRLIVVRPRNPRRFSGTVQLGFSHPQFGSNQWDRIAPYVLRTGDIYAILAVGGDPRTRAGSKPDAPMATPLILPWFDAARYAQFSWPDDGVRWDAIGQTIQRLRAGKMPGALAAFRARSLYMSGWSYLGSLQRSYINYGFHDRYRLPDGKPAVDGYLIGISSNSVDSGFGPINMDSKAPPAERQLRIIDVPVIELMSENEARTNSLPQRADTDAYAGGHRLYEVGGVSHTDTGQPAPPSSWGVQLVAHGNKAWVESFACATPPTDVPMRDLADAALDNLKRWRTLGVAPPKAPRLALSEPGKAALDRFGNAKGGVRVAQLDLALARYGEPAPGDCTGNTPFLVRRRIPLDDQTIRGAYPGGRADYLRRVRARLDALVREHWLLRPDADEQYAAFVANAAKAFE